MKKLEFSNRVQKYTTQIAAYHFEERSPLVEYENQDRYLIHTTDTVLHLENSEDTHNRYIMSHTDFQNFHIRVMSRKYVFDVDTNAYTYQETPYDIPKDTVLYLTLAIVPL